MDNLELYHESIKVIKENTAAVTALTGAHETTKEILVELVKGDAMKDVVGAHQERTESLSAQIIKEIKDTGHDIKQALTMRMLVLFGGVFIAGVTIASLIDDVLKPIVERILQ